MADDKNTRTRPDDPQAEETLNQPVADQRAPDDAEDPSTDVAHGDDVDDEDDGHEPVGSDPTEPGDGDDDSGAARTEPDVDAAGSLARSGGERLTLSEGNLRVVGTAVLHFTTRSVSVALDGDAAMRLLYRILRGRRVDWVTDKMNPVQSSARDAWLVLSNPDDVLAVEWHPGRPGGESRGVAIDPSV